MFERDTILICFNWQNVFWFGNEAWDKGLTITFFRPCHNSCICDTVQIKINHTEGIYYLMQRYFSFLCMSFRQQWRSVAQMHIFLLVLWDYLITIQR